MTASKYRVAYEYDANHLAIVRASDNRNAPPTNVTVNTWADGFGMWHAEFTTTDNAQWDVRIAKVAIGHMLTARGEKAYIPRVSRRYRRTDLPGHIHYAEV
mgnify:CR=1 FL=1